MGDWNVEINKTYKTAGGFIVESEEFGYSASPTDIARYQTDLRRILAESFKHVKTYLKMRSAALFAAAAAMAVLTKADFHIYHLNTISTDPFLPGGYMAVFHHLVSHPPLTHAVEKTNQY